MQAQAAQAAAHTLDVLLRRSARLRVAIGREYLRLKRDPAARYYTYVLMLRDSKFYVGNSDSIYTRLLDHATMSPGSAVWVREHGPVQRVVEVCRGCASDDERYKTLEYMDMFGWQNVRGASWCRPAMRAAPAALAGFRRDPARPFDHLSRREIDDIAAVVGELAALQRGPGGPGPAAEAGV
jgi:hypothetical protein